MYEATRRRKTGGRSAPKAAVDRDIRDAEPGLRAMATRITNAEEDFIRYAMSHAKLTRDQAERALAVYRKLKAIKIDAVGGQFTFKAGGFAEADVLRRAAGFPDISHEKNGWEVWQMSKTGKWAKVAGPFESESEAKKAAKGLKEGMERMFEAKTWTVEVKNGALGQTLYRGTFDSEGEADKYAKKEASQTRGFMTYTVYTGSPKSPGKAVGKPIKGGSVKQESMTEDRLLQMALEASTSRLCLRAPGRIEEMAAGGGMLPSAMLPPGPRHRPGYGAPLIEMELRSEGPRRQSTASRLDESASPPDVLSWLMTRYLDTDVSMNNSSGYVPTAGVLAQRENKRQKEQIMVIANRVVGFDAVSEWDGGKRVWVSMRSDMGPEHRETKMKQAMEAMKKAGYRVKPEIRKGRVGALYVDLDMARATKAKSAHKKYLAAMKASGAERMDESAENQVADVLEAMSPRGAADPMRIAVAGFQEGSDFDHDTALESVQRLFEALPNGTVEMFLHVLTHNLIAWDKAQMRRDIKAGRPTNIYALGLMMEAVNKVREDVKNVLKNDDQESLQLLKNSVMRRFNDFGPRRKTIKAIDAFLSTGKLPSIAKKAMKDPSVARAMAGKTESLDDLALDLLIGEGSRDKVKSIQVIRSWDGFRLQLPKSEAKKFAKDKEVQGLLDRAFDWEGAALQAAKGVFPNVSDRMY